MSVMVFKLRKNYLSRPHGRVLRPRPARALRPAISQNPYFRFRNTRCARWRALGDTEKYPRVIPGQCCVNPKHVALEAVPPL